MKYGQYLLSQRQVGWEDQYLDYDALKNLIKSLEELNDQTEEETGGNQATSLTTPKESVSKVSHEAFFVLLEQEMRKIELFTNVQVEKTRADLASLHQKIDANIGTATKETQSPDIAELQDAYSKRLQEIGDNFMQLEKYVNINYMGFHKILKKHDKRLPNPCRSFYTKRLQNQSWIRGDYSDVLVSMSRMYSKLRRDKVAKANDNAKQNFVRSTRKYWVHTEHISEIKYAILQQLPVFLQNTMGGESDSQLTTSIYIDNYPLELYRGRMEKSPGAIELRFRWYGAGDPKTVFVERKTHRESWAGELSVKERFTIREDQVLPLLQGKFDVDAEVEKLRAKGKSEEDIEEWKTLASEVVQAINSKQLVPTMRTQYMRSAFQIPFDATVRISLDTNLTMICERTEETIEGSRWYRDPLQKVPNEEITRFPHAVLEIKLQLEDESQTPIWVSNLLNSGKLLEVHKFSKFIHGCAVLMPQDVYAVPYWVDDVTLRDSIIRSGGRKLLDNAGKGANEYYAQLLPHDELGNVKGSYFHKEDTDAEEKANEVSALLQRAKSKSKSFTRTFSTQIREAYRFSDNEEEGVNGVDLESNKGHVDTSNCLSTAVATCASGPSRCWGDCGEISEDSCFAWAGTAVANHVTAQKVEPKLYFANERTFVSWLQMAVVITSLSVTISALGRGKLEVEVIGLILFPIALLFDVYALKVYFVRNDKIKSRSEDRWDDPLGAVVLASLFMIALIVIFILQVIRIQVTM